MWGKRFKKMLDKYGEQFTLRGITYRGIFKALDTGTMRTYLDDVEAAGINRPGLLLLTSADINFLTSDTINRDGRTFAVKKIFTNRISTTAIVRTVILA